MNHNVKTLNAESDMEDFEDEDQINIENPDIDKNSSDNNTKSEMIEEGIENDEKITIDTDYTEPGLKIFNDTRFNIYDPKRYINIENVSTQEVIKAPVLSMDEFLKYDPNKFFFRNIIHVYTLEQNARSYDLIKYTPDTIPFEPAYYLLFNSDISEKSKRVVKTKVSIKNMFKEKQAEYVSTDYSVLNNSKGNSEKLVIPESAFEDGSMKSIKSSIAKANSNTAPVRYYENMYIPRIMRRSTVRLLLSYILNVFTENITLYFRQNEEIYTETKSNMEPYLTVGDVSDIYVFIQPNAKQNGLIFKEIEKEITSEVKLISELYSASMLQTRCYVNEVSVLLKYQPVMYKQYTAEVYNEWKNSGLAYDSNIILDMYGGNAETDSEDTDDAETDSEDADDAETDSEDTDDAETDQINDSPSSTNSKNNKSKQQLSKQYQYIRHLPTHQESSEIHLLTNLTFGHIHSYNARREQLLIHQTQPATDTPMLNLIKFLHFDYSDKNVIKVECQTDFPDQPTDTCVMRTFKPLNEKQAFQNVTVKRNTVTIHMFNDIPLLINNENVHLVRLTIHSSGDVEFGFTLSAKYSFSPFILTSLISYVQHSYKRHFAEFFIHGAVSSFIYDINNYKAYLNTFSVHTDIQQEGSEDVITKCGGLAEYYPYIQSYSSKTTSRFNLYSYTTTSLLTAIRDMLNNNRNTTPETIKKSVNTSIYIKTSDIIEISYSNMCSMYDLYINMLVMQYISQKGSEQKEKAVKDISNISASDQLEYLRAKYSDIGKKSIKALQQIDPVTFGSIKVKNNFVPYSSIVSRPYQRPYVITDEEYEIINAKSPNSTIRVKNQTYTDQFINLFCSFPEHAVVNFKNIEGKCIPYCASKFINSKTFNACITELGSNTEERDTSRTVYNTSMYNPLADFSTITDIPQELSGIIPNVYAYRPYLTDVNQIVQYCEDMYGLYPIIIYRETSKEDNTVSYKLLTTRTNDKYTVLTMIDSESPDKAIIFVNQLRVYNRNIPTKSNEIIFNKKVYSPCIIEENIMLRDLIDSSWGLDAEIFAFYNNLKWILKSLDPSFNYSNSEINKKCIFIVKMGVVIGVIYRMYFVPTVNVKNSIDFINTIKRTKRIIKELEYRLGVIPYFNIEAKAFDEMKDMQSWSEDGMVKLIPLSVLNPRYIKDYYMDYRSKAIIGVTFNNIFVLVKPDIKITGNVNYIYVDKSTILLNFTSNVINKDLREMYQKVFNRTAKLVDEIIYMCVKNSKHKLNYNRIEEIYQWDSQKLIQLIKTLYGGYDNTLITLAGKSTYVSVISSKITEKDFLKFIEEHKNDYSVHMKIIRVNKLLHQLYKVAEDTESGTVFKKKLFNNDMFI